MIGLFFAVRGHILRADDYELCFSAEFPSLNEPVDKSMGAATSQSFANRLKCVGTALLRRDVDMAIGGEFNVGTGQQFLCDAFCSCSH
jgi:hypothetical protein